MISFVGLEGSGHFRSARNLNRGGSRQSRKARSLKNRVNFDSTEQSYRQCCLVGRRLLRTTTQSRTMGANRPVSYQDPLGDVSHSGRRFYAWKDGFLIGAYQTMDEAMASLVERAAKDKTAAGRKSSRGSTPVPSVTAVKTRTRSLQAHWHTAPDVPSQFSELGWYSTATVTHAVSISSVQFLTVRVVSVCFWNHRKASSLMNEKNSPNPGAKKKRLY